MHIIYFLRVNEKMLEPVKTFIDQNRNRIVNFVFSRLRTRNRTTFGVLSRLGGEADDKTTVVGTGKY